MRYFGHYELLEEIAHGGMGVVYKARQLTLNRLVALKMILAGRLASPAAVERFHTETEAAAQLEHTNIVPIYEVGEQDGLHYFSMKFVEGQNLANTISGKPFPLRRAAELMRKVAQAIHYAHQRGILHRDLKPANILLDSDEQPYVTDFGLAKLIEKDTSLTQSMAVMGTPAYMSPEQAAGKTKQLTTAADVYSLGAILYELLTGRPPFRGESEMDILRQVVGDEPKPPQALNPKVDRDLQTLCLKCLEKEPANRYESAEALASDLERWLTGETISARPASTTEKLWRWCRRKPALATLVTAVSALTVIVAIGSTLAAIRLKQAHQESTEKLRDSYLAQADAYRLSTRPGRRFESLNVLKKAATIRNGLDLRNEAIACMTLPDFRVVKEWKGMLTDSDLVAFDSNCERYARPDGKGNVSVRRVKDDQEIVLLHGAEQQIISLAFSPNDEYVAVGFVKGGNRWALWDLKSAQMILNPPDGDFRTFDFSHDSHQLAVATFSKSIAIYDLDQRIVVKRLPIDFLPFFIRFDPTDTKLAISNTDKDVVQIRDMKTGGVLRSFVHPDGVRGVQWHPEGRLLATACGDGNIYLWDTETGKRLTTLNGHQGVVVDVSFSPAGDLLISRGWEHSLRLWNVITGRECVNKPILGFLYGFGRDSYRFGCSPAKNTLAVLETAPGHECRLLCLEPGATRGAWNCDFSADGRVAASSHRDGVRFWNTATGERMAKLQRPGTQFVVFHPSDSSVFTSADDGLTRWPLESFANAGKTASLRIGAPEVIAAKGRISKFSVDRTGGRIAFTQSGGIRVWSVSERKEVCRFQLEQPCVSTSLSPDGTLAASGCPTADFIRVWNVETQQAHHDLPASRVTFVEFSADSRWLISGSTEEYCLWDTHSWTCIHRWRREGGTTEGRAAFAPDGKTVAVTFSASSIRLLDLVSGDELATLEPPDPQVLAWLRFSPNSTRLAAACQTHVLQLWDLQSIRHQLDEMHLDWR